MQLTLPDDLHLDQRAAAAGFADAREYVLHLVARDGESASRPENDIASDGPQSSTVKAGPSEEAALTSEEWLKTVERFAAPSGRFVDDSREACYRTAGEIRGLR